MAALASAQDEVSKQLLDNLKTLGFSKYEAISYLLLLEHQPATAYEISKQGALTKGNTYVALESLVAKGAAQPMSEKPVRYVAVDPETLFKRLARTMTGLCEDLVGSLSRRRNEKVEHVWTLEGKHRIHERVRDMISRAGRQIWIKGPDHVLIDYVPALKKAAAGGVRVLIILFGPETSLRKIRLGARAKVYLHEGTGHMLAVGMKQFVIATDFEEMLVANFGERAQGAYTRSEAVVFLADTVIRHEVYLAEIIAEHGPAIERKFGKDLIRIRQKYLPPSLARKAREHVKRLTASQTRNGGDKSGKSR